MTQPEKAIENAIFRYLNLRGIMAWKVQTVGIYDPTLKRYRKSRSPFYMRGVADIIGISKGRLIAIEVKSAKGRLSPEQKLFLDRVNENGGLGFVARSVEDVDLRLSFLKEVS